MLTSSMTPGDPQAVAAGHSDFVRHSHFNPNPNSLGTYRFGEITPHFAFELLNNDKDVVLRCLHKLRTLPMKSPVLNDSKLHRAYYNVPMQAILPLNYDKWRTIPVSGDDCPVDAGTTITDFQNKVVRLFINFLSAHTNPNAFRLFGYLALVSYFCSEGSLLHSLGICNSSDFTFEETESDGILSGDDIVESVFSTILATQSPDTELFTWNGYRVLATTILPDDSSLDIPSIPAISLRDFWYRFLQQPVDNFMGDEVLPYSEELSYYVVVPSAFSNAQNIPVDLRRLHAYNLVCAHYFSNDHVDYIFSADLYRQNMRSLADSFVQDDLFFTMNGVKYQYDALSAFVYNKMFAYSGNDNLIWADIFAFICNTFMFNRSLRFMDYFTGARLQPLAIGSNAVPVVGGNVSVIDITKNIQFQRLRNFVNRIGPKIESFYNGIFGKSPAYDFHNPFYIADTEADLFVSEVENTSTDQQNNDGFITSSMKSSADKYAFNFDSDRDSVLIGVTYFDIVRYYPFGIPRIVQHVDKYDDFLPDLQFIGDQPITGSEIGAFRTGNTAFAYTTRNQEYKISTPYCFGGIRKSLKTWSFTFPNTLFQQHLNPDFIRSNEVEFDKFFSSLKGFSFRDYYHFIILSTNLLELNRPMTKNPQIL